MLSFSLNLAVAVAGEQRPLEEAFPVGTAVLVVTSSMPPCLTRTTSAVQWFPSLGHHVFVESGDGRAVHVDANFCFVERRKKRWEAALDPDEQPQTIRPGRRPA